MAIQSKGRRVTTPRFIFALSARAERGEPARLGITVSRKAGNAVLRNRAKRLIREAFRRRPELFSPGIDVVVIVKQAPESLSLGEVLEEWERAASAVKRRSEEALARPAK